MQRVTPTVLLLAAAAAPAAAQSDILYYKFDEAGGTKVVNYYSRGGPAPAEGVVTTTDVAGAFVPGQIGAGGLRGSLTGGTGTYSYVDSGWNGSFSGDFTVAWFLKQRNTPPAANYFWGNPVGLGFRCFTAGAAARGIRVTNAGTTPLNLDLTQDIQTMAQTRFVHVALVVDSSRLTATWWVDGVVATSIPLTAGASVSATVNFRVGSQNSGTTSSTYDMDEFRFLNRAATPLEIPVWALRTQPADARFGAGCGGQLDSSGGPPRLGNNAYQLNVGGGGFSPFILSIGTSRVLLFGIPLPFNLGLLIPTLPGCNWETNLTMVLAGVTDIQGGATQPLPIPMDPSLDAAALYSQVLLLAPSYEQSTNALASSLGQ